MNKRNDDSKTKRKRKYVFYFRPFHRGGTRGKVVDKLISRCSFHNHTSLNSPVFSSFSVNGSGSTTRHLSVYKVCINSPSTSAQRFRTFLFQNIHLLQVHVTESHYIFIFVPFFHRNTAEEEKRKKKNQSGTSLENFKLYFTNYASRYQQNYTTSE